MNCNILYDTKLHKFHSEPKGWLPGSQSLTGIKQAAFGHHMEISCYSGASYQVEQ